MFHVVLWIGSWVFLTTPVRSRVPWGNSDIFLDSRTSWQAQVTSDHQALGLQGSLEQFSPGCGKPCCGKQHLVNLTPVCILTLGSIHHPLQIFSHPRYSGLLTGRTLFLKTPLESLSCQGLYITHPQLLWDADRA